MYDELYKIVLIGDSYTGKSSIITRYTLEKFEENYLSTIGIDLQIKTIQYRNKEIKLLIYDTAGAERFKSLSKTYYRGANAIIFVYDICDLITFNNITYWLEEVDKNLCDNKSNFIKILVGNKSDLEKKQIVSTELAKNFANENNMFFLECSAKENINIDEIFILITNYLITTPINNSKSIKETINLNNKSSIKLYTVSIGDYKCCN